MNKKYKQLQELYKNNTTCAKKFGLEYCEEIIDWYTRKGNKEKFSYVDIEGDNISSKKVLSYIENLVIPPMWSGTKISPNPNNHILAVGYDDKGRKQYIYHEKWSEARSLVNSYKLILFGESLGKIRKNYKKLLKSKQESRDYILGVFVFLLDETVIRVGNHHYFDENGTIGLSTLQCKHVVVKGKKVFLEFVGKSGKEHEIEIESKKLKKALLELSQGSRGFIFQYKKGRKKTSLKPSQINDFLREIAGDIVSAKDFRTWHASGIVFKDMVENLEKGMTDTKRKRILLAGFDDAAEKLGNSRAMIRESYAHGDFVESVEEKTFLMKYEKVKGVKKQQNLTQNESEFLAYIKILYNENMSGI